MLGIIRNSLRSQETAPSDNYWKCTSNALAFVFVMLLLLIISKKTNRLANLNKWISLIE